MEFGELNVLKIRKKKLLLYRQWTKYRISLKLRQVDIPVKIIKNNTATVEIRRLKAYSVSYARRWAGFRLNRYSRSLGLFVSL